MRTSVTLYLRVPGLNTKPHTNIFQTFEAAMSFASRMAKEEPKAGIDIREYDVYGLLLHCWWGGGDYYDVYTHPDWKDVVAPWMET